MEYKLIKDWESTRHGKIISGGTYVWITIDSELEELIKGEYIKTPKKEKKKKTKKIEENGGTNIISDN